MLDQLTEARDRAQNELAEAEIALLQSTAATEVLRDEVSRLNAAVAALSGEKPPAEPSAHVVEPVSAPTESANPDIHEMTPEEFDKERRRKQRQKEAEERAANPYGEVPCGGCGTKGTLQDSFITAPSGVQLRMLVCTKCNNQIMQ